MAYQTLTYPAESGTGTGTGPSQSTLLIVLPLLIVLSTFLFLLLCFLICALCIRRRRGIVLRDSNGPTDMSREELIHGEGGFEGVESRWLESVSEPVRREYIRARDHQLQYAPNSLPTDITLSQFLSIQEKGVSAWSFEPDYETISSLLVHARTEITFLPDPASSSCVQSNLPLPKLNEVYYWEVKMFDLPENTTVAVGLATKPYPAFRLPGLNRYSVAYHSSGDKSHNYPFTATPFGPPLKEGDVLGLGYRPRTGTVFFTRNGRKMEDAFVGLNRWNLFPTIGADGPCSVHVNLGQAGFVFIEANVKKWGLAPSVGTLAPPPAYGSERGSILLDVGGRGVRTNPDGTPTSSSSASTPPRRARRHRRPKHPSTGNVSVSSPLRVSHMSPTESGPPSPVNEESPHAGPSRRYISPTDSAFHSPRNAAMPDPEDDVSSSSSRSRSTSPISPTGRGSTPAYGSPSYPERRAPSTDEREGASPFSISRHPRRSFAHLATSLSPSLAQSSGHTPPDINIVVDPPESPDVHNPPTPNHRDIHLESFVPRGVHGESPGRGDNHNGNTLLPAAQLSRRDPPAYSPLDAFTYQDGVHIDLPAEFIQQALEGGQLPASAMGQANTSAQRRTRRR